MKKTIYFAVMSLALGSMSASAADCVKLSVSVKHAVAADREKTLEIVSKQVGANSGCACEVVKAAIEGSQADPTLVAAIVEAAATAAPEQAQLSAQCAIAVAPDARAKVQAVIARLGSGRSGGQTSNVVADGNNPLDFPSGADAGGAGGASAGNTGGAGDGGGTVGPRPGDAPGAAGGIGGAGGSGGAGGPGAGIGGSTPPPEIVDPGVTPPVTPVNP
ncbi:MAG: hypothetical protein KF712_05125 [Akkermansiaceae bacterium]|nr:hypothetical protein [Akkermansiaceae bacterium]